MNAKQSRLRRRAMLRKYGEEANNERVVARLKGSYVYDQAMMIYILHATERTNACQKQIVEYDARKASLKRQAVRSSRNLSQP